ncbi:MAG: low molecular weight protein-tyrosine phosphatase [Burkholderiales bacterium]
MFTLRSRNEVKPPPVLMPNSDRTRILFVCMGNICRSPTAEGVARKLIEEAGLQDLVRVDSAGTHDYHEGEPPDPRAQAAALRRGYDLSSLRARQIAEADFRDFDLLLAMDANNLALIESMCPFQHRSKLGLLMSYAPKAKSPFVPDPYCRGAADFDKVLDCIEDACTGLVDTLSVSRAALR